MSDIRVCKPVQSQFLYTRWFQITRPIEVQCLTWPFPIFAPVPLTTPGPPASIHLAALPRGHPSLLYAIYGLHSRSKGSRWKYIYFFYLFHLFISVSRSAYERVLSVISPRVRTKPARCGRPSYHRARLYRYTYTYTCVQCLSRVDTATVPSPPIVHAVWPKRCEESVEFSPIKSARVHFE